MFRIARRFDALRRISDPLYVLVVVIVFGFSLLLNFIGFHGSNAHAMIEAHESSRVVSWSLRPTFFGNLGLIAIVIGAVVIGLGHIAPRELGISWRNAAVGCAALPLAWCAFQIAECGMGVAGAGFAFNSSWSSASGIERVTSEWFGQIFGNAPYEELVFRAFLIPQTYMRMPGRSVLARLIGAILVSQVFFAAAHIGTRVFKAHLGGAELFVSLARVFVLGVAFAWIYLRTLNPFVASAFHAISNFPQPLYYSSRVHFSNDTWLAYLLVALVFGAAFPLFERYVIGVREKSSWVNES